MLNTPCPYCNAPQMPEPPQVARPYAECVSCGLSSRAVISGTIDGKSIVRYVATSHKSERGKVYTFRIMKRNEALFDEEPNKSELINLLLDKHYNKL